MHSLSYLILRNTQNSDAVYLRCTRSFEFTHNRLLGGCRIVVVQQILHVRIQTTGLSHFFLHHSPFIPFFPLSQLLVTVGLWTVVVGSVRKPTFVAVNMPTTRRTLQLTPLQEMFYRTRILYNVVITPHNSLSPMILSQMSPLQRSKEFQLQTTL